MSLATVLSFSQMYLLCVYTNDTQLIITMYHVTVNLQCQCISYDVKYTYTGYDIVNARIQYVNNYISTAMYF